jgi:NDP-sugar pyrophosphorylase family protein
MKPTLLILAAGMGSRYGGIKQIDTVGPSGEIIIDYSIYDAIRAGFGKVVFVIRKSIEQDFKACGFEAKYGNKIEIRYAFQEIDAKIEGVENLPERQKPWGTGHAILVAASEIQEPFVAINADDYYGFDAFYKVSQFLQKKAMPDAYCMVGYKLKNTLSENGTVSRGVCVVNEHLHLTDVTERTSIQRLENGGTAYLNSDGAMHDLDENSVVSMNYWGFYPNVFEELRLQFIDFVKANGDNPKAEFFIPSVINKMINDKKISCTVMTSEDQWYGVTYQEDKANVQKAFEMMLAEGVYPKSLWN